MSKPSERISVVIPVLNEEKIIEKNTKKLMDYLDSLLFLKDYEIILAENGSRDKTLRIANKLEKELSQVVVASIPFSSWGEAYRQGVALAKNSVITYAIDLAFDMAFIGRATKLLNQYPIVIGCRYAGDTRVERPLHRKLISKINAPVVKAIFGTRFQDIDGIRAMRKKVAKEIVRKTTAMGSFWDTELMVLISKSGLSYLEIPVDHVEFRKSRFKIRKLILDHLVQLLSNSRRLRAIQPRS
ncbi:MAG: glycosyltransferase [Candidatus Heimdallarchaeota archaeon]